MRKRLSEAFRNLNYEELKVLEADLRNGGELLKAALWERIAELANGQKFCAVCFRELEPGHYTLLFGPASMRKKANFCAPDCIEYFLAHLKEISARRAQRGPESI